ncbi:MAG: hypothetical protein WD844_07975 [Thermoleophilaceae bacterium]
MHSDPTVRPRLSQEAAAAVRDALEVFVEHLAPDRLPANDPWREMFEGCAAALQRALDARLVVVVGGGRG